MGDESGGGVVVRQGSKKTKERERERETARLVCRFVIRRRGANVLSQKRGEAKTHRCRVTSRGGRPPSPWDVYPSSCRERAHPPLLHLSLKTREEEETSRKDVGDVVQNVDGERTLILPDEPRVTGIGGALLPWMQVRAHERQ